MAASITGTFTLIDRASAPMRRMESQAKKTMAAIESVGAAQDKATGRDAARKMDQQARAMRNVERAAKGAGGGFGEFGRGARGAGRDTESFTRQLVRLGAVLASLRVIMRVGMFAGLAVGITTLIQAVGALGGGLAALIPRILDTVGALAALPAAIGAVVQAVGTFGLAFGGLGAALREGTQLQQQAGQQAQATADQQRRAADSIRAAERNLFLAQRSSGDAQRQLTEARRQARRELTDLRLAAEGAVLGEARAALSLREARDALARAAVDPGTTSLGLESASLAVREAQLGMRTARAERGRARADARRGLRRGIGGNQNVIQAQRSVADAAYNQAEASRSLAEAQREANRQMREGTTQAQGFRTAMAELSPEARTFVRQLLGMRGAVRDLRAAAGRDLFPALGRALGRAGTLLPTLRRGLRRTGGVIGGQVEGFAQDMTTPRRRQDIGTLMGHQAGLINRGGRALRNVSAALLDLAIAARPFTNWLADTIVGWTQFWRESAAAGRATGRTRAFLDRARSSLEQLGRITKNVWITLRELGRAARPLGDRLWDGAERATKGWADFMQTAEGSRKVRGWFDALYDPLHEMGQLTKDLALAWARITINENFTRTLQELRTVVPHIERLMNNLSGTGPEAAAALREVVRFLSLLPFQPLELLLRAFTKMLTVLNDLIETVPGLGLAISGLATAAMVASIASLLGKFRAMRWAINLAGRALRAFGRRLAAVAGMEAAGNLAGATASGVPDAMGRRRGRFNRFFRRFGRGLGAVAGVALAAGIAASLWEELSKRFAKEFGPQGVLNPFEDPNIGGPRTQRLRRRSQREARRDERAGRGPSGPMVDGERLMTNRDNLEWVRRNLRSRDPAARRGARSVAETAGFSRRELTTGRLSAEHRREDAALRRRLRGQEREESSSHRRRRRNATGEARNQREEVGRTSRRQRDEVNAANSRTERHSAGTWRRLRRAVGDNARGARREAVTEFDRMRQDSIKALVGMGYSRSDAVKLLTGKSAVAPLAGDPTSGGGAAGGGNVPIGPPAPNQHGGRVRRRGAGGMRIRGVGRSDTVPVAPGHLAAPGELIVNRHTENRVNTLLRPHGTTLGSEVTGEKRPHAQSPALNRARAGRFIWSHQRGGRIVPIPGQPGESIFEPILPALQQLISQYKLRVTDGWASGGHAPNSDHYWGGAVDLVPGAGGSWELIDALARWAEPSQNQPRHPFRWVGYTGDAGHGRGHHLHLSWLREAVGAALGALPGAAGGGGVAGFPGIRARRSRRRGAPGGMVNAATAAYAHAVNSLMGGGAGGGGAAPVAAGSYNAQTMAQLWTAAGGDPRMARLMGAIGMAESRGDPRALGIPTSGGRARGLWQIMWPLHQARFPGMDPYNPVDNAKMAVAIHRSQGLGAWEAYTRGMHRQFMQTGGRVPDWGGWNQRGGRFRVDRPTLFGAGENGAENVTISRGGGGGRGGRPPATVSVVIENYNREGEIAEHIRREMELLADDIELVGSEED